MRHTVCSARQEVASALREECHDMEQVRITQDHWSSSRTAMGFWSPPRQAPARSPLFLNRKTWPGSSGDAMDTGSASQMTRSRGHEPQEQSDLGASATVNEATTRQDYHSLGPVIRRSSASVDPGAGKKECSTCWQSRRAHMLHGGRVWWHSGGAEGRKVSELYFTTSRTAAKLSSDRLLSSKTASIFRCKAARGG